MCVVIESSPKPMSNYITSGDEVQITHVFQKKKRLKVEKYIEAFQILKAMPRGEFHIKKRSPYKKHMKG